MKRSAYIRVSILGFFVLLFAVSCSNSISDDKLAPKAAAAQSIRWHTESSFDDVSGPKGSISLVRGSETFPLKINRPVAFQSLEREHQSGWGVPKDAEISALGYWAGYGEVLYAVITEKEIRVYHREVEEQVKPLPFKLIKRIR